MKVLSNRGLTFDDVLLVPGKTRVSSRDEISLRSYISGGIFSNTPFIASPMDSVVDSYFASRFYSLGGYSILHRFQSIKDQVTEAKQVYDIYHAPIVGAAVGIRGDYLERVEALSPYVNLILIDVAQGYSFDVIKAMTKIKEVSGGLDLMVGSIATYDAADELLDDGIVDAFRVGIGPGSACSTRIKTGVGVPQLTAISEVSKAVEDHGRFVPIVADGGIRNSGDIAKAIAAGAASVMMGRMFAASYESAADKYRYYKGPILENEKRYLDKRNKEQFTLYRDHTYYDYEGMASKGTSYIEGVKISECKVKYLLEEIVTDLKEGVRSAVSYVGGDKLYDLDLLGVFQEVSSNCVKENYPRYEDS